MIVAVKPVETPGVFGRVTGCFLLKIEGRLFPENSRMSPDPLSTTCHHSTCSVLVGKPILITFSAEIRDWFVSTSVR